MKTDANRAHHPRLLFVVSGWPDPEVTRGTWQVALLDLDNVVLVPHLGSATRETRTAMADLAVRNVLAVLGGQPPLTPVAPRS